MARHSPAQARADVATRPLGVSLADMRRRLFAQEQPFLLESGSDADGCGGTLYAGCAPFATYEWSPGDASSAANRASAPMSPLQELSRMAASMPCIAVGHIGYGVGSHIEPSVPGRSHAVFPDISFAFYDAVLRMDLSSKETDPKVEWIGPGRERLAAALTQGRVPPLDVGAGLGGPLMPDVSKEVYQAHIERLLGYIRDGDVYQVNYTFRLRAPFSGRPPDLYRHGLALCAPFGGYLDLGQGRALVSGSPERFLAVKAGQIETRPIKGTSPPGGDAGLVASEKDRAEHVMIVDVSRNDLGRVCKIGSVAVEGLGRAVAFPSLCHLVSTVRGALRPDVNLAEILAATFPGASVTGAPKVRAMQIISELEVGARGPYTGAFGRIGPFPCSDGLTSIADLEMDFAMAIRTVAASPGQVELGVGGGVVADSTPEGEWAEAELKASAWTQALTSAR